MSGAHLHLKVGQAPALLLGRLLGSGQVPLQLPQPLCMLTLQLAAGSCVAPYSRMRICQLALCPCQLSSVPGTLCLGSLGQLPCSLLRLGEAPRQVPEPSVHLAAPQAEAMPSVQQCSDVSTQARVTGITCTS